MAFTVESGLADGTLKVALRGAMNEEARSLPALGAAGINAVVLDLDGLVSMNSVGIRLWKEWLAGMPAGRSLILKNVRRALIMQINAVLGFLPAQAKVESIYVPFFCEDCDAEEERLFETAKLGAEAPVVKLSRCQKATCKPEADVVWDRYVAFLKTK